MTAHEIYLFTPAVGTRETAAALLTRAADAGWAETSSNVPIGRWSEYRVTAAGRTAAEQHQASKPTASNELPEVGKMLRVWLPGELAWVECTRVNEDGSWLGRVDSDVVKTAEHKIACDQVIRLVASTTTPGHPWKVAQLDKAT
jgi:hypothetical protein